MNSDTMNNDVTMVGETERALLVNRYRIVRQLGQGGMGSVWLAEDTLLDGKNFAIKMLPSILVSNKRAYNQLKSEALVAMKLVHPNIVQIRAFEENGNNPFLVMDYIDGETLDEWLGDRGQESGVSEEDVIRLLKPIAEALDYAHAEGVVHRDIKPANVMIRKDGRPFIMDFGIAREIQETMTRVTGKMSSGTLMYMSPEQLNGDVPKPAQDVYSFAAMVYECLKGEPPFCRGNIEFQIMNKEPEPLTSGRYGQDEVRFAEQSRKRPARVPASRVQESGSIASSVMAALAKKPEDRPKSCLAVLLGGAYGSREKELESGVNSQGSGEAKSQETCECPRQPHRGLFGNIAAIILLVFGLAGGIWYWQGTHENGVVSDSLISAKPSAKTNLPPPSPPLSGPTELDVMEVKVESSAQKGRIERIDDADGFKIKKDGLSEQAEDSHVALPVSALEQSPVCSEDVLSTQVTEDGYTWYTVRRGDTLSKIAHRYSMSPKEVAEINGLTRYVVRLGQRLKVRAEVEERARKVEAAKISNDIIINITGDGILVLNGCEVNHSDLSLRLSEFSKKYPNQTIIIRVDQFAKYELLTMVMDTCRKVGNLNFSIKACDKKHIEHEMVQLWEGGPFWATKNIGAEKPEDTGYYFWWGDTVGYKQEGKKWVASDGSRSNFSFSEDNTPTYGKSISELESKGWIEKKNGTYVLTSKHDAAQAHWGGAWRMPTKEELGDLFSKCDWTRTTRNGKNGHVVRGKGNYASKSIFLPCAGEVNMNSLYGACSGGNVWSSVPYSGRYYAYLLNFYSGFRYTYNFDRFRGQCVRPVQGFTK